MIPFLKNQLNKQAFCHLLYQLSTEGEFYTRFHKESQNISSSQYITSWCMEHKSSQLPKLKSHFSFHLTLYGQIKCGKHFILLMKCHEEFLDLQRYVPKVTVWPGSTGTFIQNISLKEGVRNNLLSYSRMKKEIDDNPGFLSGILCGKILEL